MPKGLHNPQTIYASGYLAASMQNNNPLFSIKESLIFGWESFVVHYRIFVPVVFLSVAISFASEFIANHNIGTLMYIALVVGTIAQIIVGMGVMKLALKVTAGEPITFDDAFSVTHKFFLYLASAFLYVLIVLGGLVLFIVPGLLWLVSYWLFPYVLIDTEVGVLAALSEAKRISKGARWQLFQFMCVTVVLNLAGALAFFVGLLATIPLTAIATAHVYRQLVKPVRDVESAETAISG